MKSEDRNPIFRFGLFGFCFGLCFPLIAICFDIIYRGLGLSWEDTVLVHRQNPLHFIIYSAPFILSATALLICKFVQKREVRNREFVEKELQKNQQISRITQCLLEGQEYEHFSHHLLDEETLRSLETIGNRLKEQQESDLKNQWALEGQAEVMETLKILGEGWQSRLLSILCKRTQSRKGVFWQLSEADENACMLAKGRFAGQKAKTELERIEIGQGLCGQVWQTGQLQQLTQVPNHYLKVSSGLGETDEVSLLILPIKLEEQVLGVIELASFSVLPTHYVEWIQQVAGQVGVKIASIHHEQTLQSLLDTTRERIQLLEVENARLQQA